MDHEGLLPIHRAVRFGHVAAAHLLLEAGAHLQDGGSKKRKKSGKSAEENPTLILPNLPRLSPDASDDGLGLTPLMHAMHVQVCTYSIPVHTLYKTVLYPIYTLYARLSCMRCTCRTWGRARSSSSSCCRNAARAST